MLGGLGGDEGGMVLCFGMIRNSWWRNWEKMGQSKAVGMWGKGGGGEVGRGRGWGIGEAGGGEGRREEGDLFGIWEAIEWEKMP